ncbi:MAG: substrate-binding domain-containing protein [Spirochaetaceae bacterium]
MQDRSRFKYEHIYGELKRLIEEGHYRTGERLPSEAELAESFNVSRPTVTRALRALTEERLINRRAGSGSFVLEGENQKDTHRLFGLLISGLGQREIFEPITGQIATLAEANDFSLLWSGSELSGEDLGPSVVSVAKRYVSSGVSGVFFAPVEFSSKAREINEAVIALFSQAEIPVVLIDTDYVPFPGRSAYDLVGIDNFRGGYVVTEHLLETGAGRVDFLARPYSAYTISLRQQGYRTALLDRGIAPREEWIHSGEPDDAEWVTEELLNKGVTELVCGNDETAASLMHTLDSMSVAIPSAFRIVGFDDVRYAKLLRVPLTTLHQPVAEIGSAAVELMLWRAANPLAAARQVIISGHLVVRRSSQPTP